MARHLERKHMEMKDVAYAFSFPLGSKDRKGLLEQLRNKGDFKHNTKVLEEAKSLSKFRPSKNEFGKPSTAVKLGFSLKGAVEVLIGQTLMNEDDLGEKRAKRFFELLEKNWKNYVSVSAHQTIKENSWNKQDDIPLTKNVMALRDHLRIVEDEAREKLSQQLSLPAYKQLNEAVLAQVIIFNKRREGEASRLTLDTYKKVNTTSINDDIYETLSPLEKELSKLLTRIEIRGKRGRKMEVLTFPPPRTDLSRVMRLNSAFVQFGLDDVMMQILCRELLRADGGSDGESSN
ncbi:hypothetical protein JOQ06_022243, partial [Pogonophryne albipinna]